MLDFKLFLILSHLSNAKARPIREITPSSRKPIIIICRYINFVFTILTVKMYLFIFIFYFIHKCEADG